MDDLQNEILESLPEDVSSESSPEVNPELDQEGSPEATGKEAEPKEPPFNEHPRWKEVMEEKRIAQERADRLEQQLLEISGKLATPKTNEADPYEGLEGDMKDWAKFIDQRAEAKAKAIAKQEREAYMKEHQVTREQLAMIAYKEFKTRHPDVKPNSPEENAIASKVKLGYSPDDAYEIVVGSTKRQALEEELAKIKQGKQKVVTKQKLAANLETDGLTSGSPISPKEKMSVADFVAMQMAKGAA